MSLLCKVYGDFLDNFGKELGTFLFHHLVTLVSRHVTTDKSLLKNSKDTKPRLDEKEVQLDQKFI